MELVLHLDYNNSLNYYLDYSLYCPYTFVLHYNVYYLSYYFLMKNFHFDN